MLTSNPSNLFEYLQGNTNIFSMFNLEDDARNLSLETIQQFRCPADPHFCETGNQWLADVIYNRFYAESELVLSDQAEKKKESKR